jgi:hypothetical protein
MSNQGTGNKGKKMQATTTEDLSWFDRNDYAVARGFDSREWFAALSIRDKALQLEKSESYKKAWPQEKRWENFNTERIPTQENLSQYLPDNITIANIISGGVYAELDVSKTGENAKSYADEGWKILAVNPTAPHPLLLAQLKDWVVSLPNPHPPGIKRRGRPADNIEITQLHLDTWKSYSVLECLDIDLWASIFMKAELPSEKLYGLVTGPEITVGAKDWGDAARDASKMAILALQLLAYKLRDQN